MSNISYLVSHDLPSQKKEAEELLDLVNGLTNKQAIVAFSSVVQKLADPDPLTREMAEELLDLLIEHFQTAQRQKLEQDKRVGAPVEMVNSRTIN